MDDEREILDVLSIRLGTAGYEVALASSGEEALARLALARPDVVITDLRMEGMDGLVLFEQIRRRHPALPVIVLTAHGTIPDAVRAAQEGVFSFLTKPFEGEALLDRVAEAMRLSGGAGGDVDGGPFCEEIDTRSPLMEECLREARLAARSDLSVLIQGESGVGKALLGRAIHRASRRRAGPFVVLPCAALPNGALGSELFGHRRGAVAAAATDAPGALRAASGGTLVLAEVGDLPAALQAELLRALRERRVRPLGSTEYARIDVRVVATTTRDLEAEVRAGAFRRDLFDCLSVVRLSVPSLASRPEDIPALAGRFLAEAAARLGKSVRSFSPRALELLRQASWPGNVRQLRNAVEQAVVLATSRAISRELVARAVAEEAAPIPPFSDARREFERDYFIRLLKATGGNVSRAAALAARNRTEFYKLLQRHRLTPADFRGP